MFVRLATAGCDVIASLFCFVSLVSVCLQTTTPICAAPSTLLRSPDQEPDEEQPDRVSPVLWLSDDITGLPVAALIYPLFLSAGPPYLPPFSPDPYEPVLVPSRDLAGPDYDDYSPAGGSRPTFRGSERSYNRPDYG